MILFVKKSKKKAQLAEFKCSLREGSVPGNQKKIDFKKGQSNRLGLGLKLKGPNSKNNKC
jgi:hypothetical protein